MTIKHTSKQIELLLKSKLSPLQEMQRTLHVERMFHIIHATAEYLRRNVTALSLTLTFAP